MFNDSEVMFNLLSALLVLAAHLAVLAAVPDLLADGVEDPGAIGRGVLHLLSVLLAWSLVPGVVARIGPLPPLSAPISRVFASLAVVVSAVGTPHVAAARAAAPPQAVAGAIVVPPPVPPVGFDRPAPAAAPVVGDDARTRVVARGENLWVIARAVVRAAAGIQPCDREVHAYWVRLIARNADSLASGDPDVVLPGEVLHLPDTG